MLANRFALACATLAIGSMANGQEMLDATQMKDSLTDILWVDAGEAAYFLSLLQLDDHARQDAAAAHEAYTNRLIEIDAVSRRGHVVEASWDMLVMEDQVAQLQEALFIKLNEIATTAGRADAFGRVEMARRREATAFFETSGPMGIDLVAIAFEAGVNQEPIRDVLRRYELEIDPLYEQYVADMPKFAHLAAVPPEGGPTPVRELELDEEGFPTEAEEARLDAERASMLARAASAKAINDKYKAMIADALPETEKSRWDLAVKRREWPWVYAMSEAERTLEAAGSLDDLTPKQREQLDTIKAEHETKASEINETWARAIEARDAAERRDDWMVWNKQIERADAAEVQRAELDKATIDRIKALLTPEQFDLLHATPTDRPSA